MYLPRRRNTELLQDGATLHNSDAFIYRGLGKDSILLGALAYNIGPGAVNKSIVYKMLKSGNRNIFRAYTSLCHYKGKWHKGLYNRRLTELGALFIP
jgi:hypothetical protein